jgi:CRISPR-associated protein Csy1
MPQASVERARQLLGSDDIAGARRECAAILASAANGNDKAAAHLVLAECSRRGADIAAATRHAQSAVVCAPADPAARYALAELLEKAGDLDGAIASLRRAIELQPAFVQGWNYLGILLGERDDYAGAEEAFAQTVRLDPQRATAWNNLGNARRSLGRLEEARACFTRALTLRPDYPLAAANLATAQRDLGDAVEAERSLRQALARRAGEQPFRPLLIILAGLLRERGAFDESAQLYRQAIEAEPRASGGEWVSLAQVLTERGETERARDAYVQARALAPDDLRAAIGARLVLPLIYDDTQAVATSRARYRAGLADLHRELDTLVRPLPEQKVLDGLRWTNFFLAYQGGDDRELQQSYADFARRAVETAAPHWRGEAPQRPSRPRLRVGFASAFFHVGTVGRYFCNWITDLDRERFEVFVYHLFPGMDEVAAAIAERADTFRSYGGMRARPSIVAPDIRADLLDVLIYPELGMDVTSFALAALRLAPRQYAAWGHPVTTGHPTIDAFFSCAAMETEGCAAHYSERVILLPGIGTRYKRPAIPARSDADRERFGFPRDRHLLLCPQSLFKVHPDNDDLFARVLAANPDSLLILFAGRHPAITDQYMRRFARACDARGIDVRARARVIPALPHDDFLRVNLACDAMLDTLHWSGGNTSLDALACALPIVTLPGPYMRSRQTAGMLSLLGISDLIASDADDYVRIATRLVAEHGWRRELAARIAAGHTILFDSPDAIDRLQQVLLADDPART